VREHDRTLARLRKICLALPETSERLSHGAPTFFVRGKRAFLMVLTNHHGDGRFAIWCAAADGIQRMLVEADPERFFVPPYVGHRGWLGVRLDRGLDWDELSGIAEDAYAEVAPKKLVEEARLGADSAYDSQATPSPSPSRRYGSLPLTRIGFFDAGMSAQLRSATRGRQGE
jgi:hypothetical protein